MKRIASGIVCCLCCLCMPVQGNEAIDRIVSVYERESGKIEDDFRNARLALPPQHIAVLRNMETHFQTEGNLSVLLTVQQARQKFVVDPTPSGLTSLQEPDVLARLERRFLEQYAEAGKSRYDRLSGLQSQYRTALSRLQVQLTQDGEIEDAKRVTELLAAIIPVTATTAAPAPVMPVAGPAPVAMAAAVGDGGTGGGQVPSVRPQASTSLSRPTASVSDPATASPQGPSAFKLPRPQGQGMPRVSFDQALDDFVD